MSAVCRTSNPAPRSTLEDVLGQLAAGVAGEHPAEGELDGAGWRAEAVTSDVTSTRSWSYQSSGGVDATSVPANSASPIASSSSSLFLTCQYSAIGVTPNSLAHAADGDRVEALGVGDVERAVDDRGPAELSISAITLDNYTP